MKEVKLVENVTDIVAKPSSSKKFKHCLNSIEHISCSGCGGAPLPIKELQREYLKRY
jgi:hypothetical protein